MTGSWWRHEDDARFPLGWTVRAAMGRITVSIVAPIVWLAGTLLFFGFWARGFTVAQDIIVGVVSVLALLAVLLALWLSFGARAFHRWVDG